MKDQVFHTPGATRPSILVWIMIVDMSRFSGSLSLLFHLLTLVKITAIFSCFFVFSVLLVNYIRQINICHHMDKKPHFWSPGDQCWVKTNGNPPKHYLLVIDHEYCMMGCFQTQKTPGFYLFFGIFPDFWWFFWSQNTVFMDDWRPVWGQNHCQSSKTLFHTNLSWILWISAE